MPEPHEHCPHNTGEGAIKHGFGGSFIVVCCVCGMRGTLPFKIETRQLPGHGPHFREKYQEFGEVHWEPQWSIHT